MGNKWNSEERREYRRKRRQRNQIVAYIVLFLIIALAAVGIVQGMKYHSGQQQEEETIVQESHQAVIEEIEEIISSEEEIAPPTATPVPTEVPKTPQELWEERIDAQIAAMPLTDKVAGLFVVTPEAVTGVGTAIKAGNSTKEALEKYPVGGIIYFKKNIRSAEQLKEMIGNTKAYSKYPVFIAVDEEGGSVSRLANAKLATKQPSAAEIGATKDANNAYQAGTAIGSYLAEFGFDLNFAPVADLSNVENSIMKDRAYGADAATAVPFVTAMMNGLEEQGVTACLKHFPGIGSTTADTHKGMVSIGRSAEELWAEELTVFQAGIDAGAQMIMVGHADAESLSGDKTPACMSKVIITDVLRNELGFQGVVISDALNMSAISEYYSSEQAAVMALKAGCDMILMPENFEQAYTGVLNAVAEGTISEERINDSLKRIYRIKLAEELVLPTE